MYNYFLQKKLSIILIIFIILFYSVFILFENNIKIYSLIIAGDVLDQSNIDNILFNFKITYLIIFPFLFTFVYFVEKNYFLPSTIVFKLTPFLIFSCWMLNHFIFSHRSFFFNNHIATHWLFSYFDFGFIKRGLAGTIMEVFGKNIKNNFYYIFFISNLIFLILTYLIFSTWNLLKNNKYLIFFFLIIITSPSTISFFLSDVGRFDQINYIIFMLLFFHLLKYRNNYNFYYVVLLNIFAALIHEGYFLLQFPIFFSFLIFLYIEKCEFNHFNLKIFFKLSFVLLIMIFFTIIIYKFGYVKNFDLNEIKNYFIEISNFKVIEESPIETYNKNIFHFGIMLSKPYKTFFADSHYSTFILSITYFLIFLPCIATLSYLWSNILKACKSLKHFTLNVFLLISSFIPFFIGAFLLGFIDHYRFFSSIILLNFICFSFSYSVIKTKIIFNKYIFNIINVFFIIFLLYNVILNTFFAPLEKNALLFSKLIYYVSKLF